MTVPSAPPAYTASVPPTEPQQMPPHPMPSYEDFRMQQFKSLIVKHEISEFFAAKLRILDQFEIVLILDDSGSMQSKLKPPPNNPFAQTMTRWEELLSTCIIITEIATLFDTNGIDYYFLNRGVIRNINTPIAAQSAFSVPPQGWTPTADIFRLIYAEKRSVLAEKKLLIVCLTDGEPTDRNGSDDKCGLWRALEAERQPIEKIHVVIVACTDDDETMQYLNGWDNQIPNLDVVDDFVSERREIQRVQGPQFPFSKGDYVCKLLLGSIDKSLDSLDESRPGQSAVPSKYQAAAQQGNDNCCVIS